MEKKLDFQILLPKSVGHNPGGEHFILTKHGQKRTEYFFLKEGEEERKVFLHDYNELYRVPYLYESLMVRSLECLSHQVLTSFMAEQIAGKGGRISDLTFLDLAAGSGLVGSALRDLGVGSITAIDIIPEAKVAAMREAAGVYENYYVENLDELSLATEQQLTGKGFSGLICCSAVNAIPISVLVKGFNFVRPNGWVAFNVRKGICDDTGPNGLVGRHPWIENPDIFELAGKFTYRHRYRTHGSSIEYVAFAGIKKRDIEL